MSRPTTFLHLTDLHIAQPGVPDGFLNSDTSATLEKVLAEIKTYDPAPDFIIVSGDLTNRGTEPAFAELKRLLDEAALPIPLLLALGNHDTRAPFYKVMLGRTDNVDAPYDYDVVIAGIHIIVLDTSIPMQGHGARTRPARLVPRPPRRPCRRAQAHRHASPDDVGRRSGVRMAGHDP